SVTVRSAGRESAWRNCSAVPGASRPHLNRQHFGGKTNCSSALRLASHTTPPRSQSNWASSDSKNKRCQQAALVGVLGSGDPCERLSGKAAMRSAIHQQRLG